MGFAAKLVEESRDGALYLIHGSEHGAATWYYLRAKPGMEPVIRQIKTGKIININLLGCVICSGYGDVPPDELLETIA